MQAVTIATFNTAPPAERLRDGLLQAGIPTRVRDQRLGFLARPSCWFHLDVQKEYCAKANDLLSRWQTRDHVLAEAIRCPQCDSLRIEHPRLPRQFEFPALVADFFGVVRHRFLCHDCQHTWRPSAKAEAGR